MKLGAVNDVKPAMLFRFTTDENICCHIKIIEKIEFLVN
ncbi:hypothetical protein BH10PSE7_BH10PSE7_18610 [soil metagenome]